MTYYPCHLAQVVAERLQTATGHTLEENILVRLFETLYFASFRTEEGRGIQCTVNYVDPQALESGLQGPAPANRWSHVTFQRPIPLDVRSLTKLAQAVDPDVASLTVYADGDGELHIWGMVDQEPRHGDHITLEADDDTPRPGLFQVTISGTGNLAVYRDAELLGSLSQNQMVEAYHDVLWGGPVHDMLRAPLRAYMADAFADLDVESSPGTRKKIEREFVLRWLNSLSRVLVNVRHYRHGGGLLMVPHVSFENVNIKYRVTYGRLLQSIAALVRAQFLRGRAMAEFRGMVERDDTMDDIRTNLPLMRELWSELEHRKSEVLGCSRFIASLSCVDGVVLLDQFLTVHGFGVELRTDVDLVDVYMAGDVAASPARLREVDMTQFGTRHRAMMRYCYQYPGALGFAVSQDGHIQALTRLDGRLVLWENIDLQLAVQADSWPESNRVVARTWRRFGMRAAV